MRALPLASAVLALSIAAVVAVGAAPARASEPGDDDLRLTLRPSTALLARAIGEAQQEPSDAAGKKDKAAPAPAKAAPAPAADDDAPAAPAKKADADDADEKATSANKEVKVGGAVLGDSVGGATGFVFKQGFYTESDLGGFFRLGGYTIADKCGGVPCEPVATSQLQPYIGLSGGYDLFQWLGIQASFGTGFVSNAAPYGGDGSGCGPSPAPRCASENTPRDYGITMLDLGVVAQWYFLDRLALAFKLFGGGAFLTPEPDVGEPFAGGNFGVGLGLRWASLLPDTFVGIDANFHAVFIPASGGALLFIPGFSFAPVIKYVF
jgi:hypothetical protein